MTPVFAGAVKNTRTATESKEFKIMKLIYTAMSKRLFYFRMHISKYVLEHNGVPLDPFMIHEYFLLDTVSRDKIRTSNNTLVEKSDEIWVFGKISDGVLAEIKLAKKLGKNIKYFEVINSRGIKEISEGQAKIEET